MTAWAVSGDDAETAAARALVQEFCQAEYAGAQSVRFTLVKFSPEREAKEKRADPIVKGRGITWDWDASRVVTSFHVDKVSIRNDSGVALVVFRQIARVEKRGRVIPNYIERDVVKLRLVRDGDRWRVLDPPYPRVSSAALAKIYRDDLSRMGEGWLADPRISKDQKNRYRQKQGNVRLIELLSGGPATQ